MLDLNKEEWMRKSACQRSDPTPWFSDKEEDQLQAKEFCNAECSVRLECLAYAFKNNIEHGVWGGLKESERRTMRKKKHKQLKEFLKTGVLV